MSFQLGQFVRDHKSAGFGVRFWKIIDETSPHLFSRYSSDVFSTPSPYTAELRKLIDEESSIYNVGQVISPMSKPA